MKYRKCLAGLTIFPKNTILIILTSFSLNASLAKFHFLTACTFCWIASHINIFFPMYRTYRYTLNNIAIDQYIDLYLLICHSLEWEQRESALSPRNFEKHSLSSFYASTLMGAGSENKKLRINFEKNLGTSRALLLIYLKHCVLLNICGCV